MTTHAHLLIGCGGTGISTLTRILELMSQDSMWRHSLYRNVAFVLVDTDQSEFTKFQEAMDRNLSGLKNRPMVASLNLSRQMTVLQPHVRRAMMTDVADPSIRQEIQRLRKHHWHEGENAPYHAPHVQNVTIGAGQCPFVSHFLTWLNLPKFQTQLEDLHDGLKKRRDGDLNFLNTLIVAGLAGGTGRGSWELIGFKVRDVFRRRGQTVSPHVFLVDQSAYENVKKLHPDQELPMKVNSLTGFSQLSAWMNNRDNGRANPESAWSYSLPSLASPLNPESDIIRLDLNADVNSSSPANNAFLLFRDNGAIPLDTNKQYFDMLGAGIYAALSKSAIASSAINSHSKYYSLATTLAGVDTASLTKFFALTAKIQLVENLGQLDPPDIDHRVVKFVNSLYLTRITGAEAYSPKRDGNLLQRVIDAMQKLQDDAMNQINSAFEEDDRELVEQFVQAYCTEDESLVQNAIKIIAEDLTKLPSQLLDELVHDVLSDTKSIECVRALIEKVIRSLESAIEDFSIETDLGDPNPIKTVVTLAGRKYIVTGECFEQHEQKLIRQVTFDALVKNNQRFLRRGMQQLLKTWIKSFEVRLTAAERARKELERVLADLTREREADIAGDATAMSRLFTDPAHPEKTAEDPTGGSRSYLRELKPILTQNRISELLLDIVDVKGEVLSVIRDAIRPQVIQGDIAYDTYRQNLRRSIRSAIDSTVAIPDDFMMTHFSVRMTLVNLVHAWKTRLQQPMSVDQRRELEDSFDATFGFVPSSNQTNNSIEYDIPDADTLLHLLATSLAKNCKPYWRTRNVSFEEQTSISLFFNTDWKSEQSSDFISQRLNEGGRSDYAIVVNPRQDTTKSDNPFAVIAYSTEGINDINQITSLDYHSDASVQAFIKQTEDPSGSTIFGFQGRTGLGYPTPIFVTEEQLRNLRWKPWADTVLAKQEQKQGRALAALLYALFPGKTDEGILASVSGELQTAGWPMPLITMTSGNRFKVARLPLIGSDGKYMTDHQTQTLLGWSFGAPVAPSAGIHNVLGRLETGDAADAWVDRILRENELFWSEVMPGINRAPGTPAAKAVVAAYETWLSSEFQTSEDEAQSVWGELLKLVRDWMPQR